ncbi:hypothetical protein Tco_0353328 [Tanacetum coccineum]
MVFMDDQTSMEELHQSQRRKGFKGHGRTFNWQTATYDMAPLPSRDQRYPWLRYQVEGYAEDIVHSYEQRLEMIWGRLVNRVYVLDFAGLTKGMSGQAPEKVTGVDLFYLRSMDRGTDNILYLLAQYLFRHAERRKSGARLSGGHFIGCLAAHFGLVSDQGLRGLSVVTRELLLLDLHELGRLSICERIGDMWAWVSPGPKRQLNTAAGALGAAEDAPAVDKGCQANPAPAFATWMVSCITQLMDASGRTYHAFDSTLIGSSRLPYQRRTRRRTGDASTSAP